MLPWVVAWEERNCFQDRLSRKISREDLQKAKEMANHIGRYGEQYVNEYLFRLQEEGKIRNFKWVSGKTP